MSDEKHNAAEELANEIKAESWNACITPHLESLRSWYNSPAWEKSVLPYLKQVQERMLYSLLKRGLTREDDEFIKGQMAMLLEVINIPKIIDVHLSAKEKASNQARPTGDAGY